MDFKGKPLFAALLAALVPVPVAAFDSGVNGMAVAIDYENQHQSAASWALEELMRLEGGSRHELAPIYPQPKQFNLIDAQIADIIAQGELEKEHLAELINELSVQELPNPDEPQGAVMYEQVSIDQDLTEFDSSLLQSSTPFGESLPEVKVMDEDGYVLNVDTDGLLPATEADPRDGGSYSSEIDQVQDVFDMVQMVQDQVPAPIQSKGNDLYNQITGTEKPE